MDPELQNRKLRLLFGEQGGNANFRLALSGDQREYRYGTYTDFTPGGIYLRTVTEVRETPKYPYKESYWVLEKLFPNLMPDVIRGTNWSYEPLIVFYHPITGEYMPPPPWRVTEAIVHTYLFSEKQFKTEADHAQEFQRELDKQKEVIYDYFNDLFPTKAVQVNSGEGIFVP
jgi:hypothetical protein